MLKKIAALVLCLTLLASLAVPALAETNQLTKLQGQWKSSGFRGTLTGQVTGEASSLTGEALWELLKALFAGYQLNLPVQGEGFFMLFRREQCPEDTFHLRLRGIDPEAVYSVEDFDGGVSLMKGSKLASQVLTFAEPRSYKLVFYKKV